MFNDKDSSADTGIVDDDQSSTFQYKARLVSSQGPIGCKCPRWHVDHVPLRLVMSLKGPGCVYIPHELEMRHCDHDHVVSETLLVNRTALNHMDFNDSNVANSIIVPNEELALTAKEMEAVLLMGRYLEDDRRNEVSNGRERLSVSSFTKPAAVPHKSPTLELDEKRILLTLDVLPQVQETVKY